MSTSTDFQVFRDYFGLSKLVEAGLSKLVKADEENPSASYLDSTKFASESESLYSEPEPARRRFKLPPPAKIPRWRSHCAYCRKNGVRPREFVSHLLRRPRGEITCPILRAKLESKLGET